VRWMEVELLNLLRSNRLIERGIQSESELTEIIQLFKGEDESSLEAGKFLVCLLNPELHLFRKGTISPDEVAKTLFSSGCLEKLLLMGTQGLLTLHNEIKPADIERSDVIGKGRVGTVYQGTWNGKQVAIKYFNSADEKEFRKELSMMSLIRQTEFVLPCYGGCTKGPERFIVCELMEVSLYDLIHDQGFCIERLIVAIAISVAKSLSYLHENSIIHRDLKSLNLLVNKYFEIKLCDFGLSRVVDTKALMTGCVGTVGWIAPEIFSEKKFYSEKADIYSFGMVCWELLTRQTPFENLESFSVPVLVLKGKRPPLPKEGNKAFRKLIKNCWSQKPENRPNISKVLNILVDMIRKPERKTGYSQGSIPTLTGNFQLERGPSGFSLVCLTSEDPFTPRSSDGSSSSKKTKRSFNY